MTTPDPAGGSSAALLRRLNTRTVLDAMWAGRPATASDLMRRTGLTRATVLAVCRELTEQGWLRPAQDTRSAGTAYTKGRPALRYAFAAEKTLVVGVDAGQHRIAARITDLAGRDLGVAERAQDLTVPQPGEPPCPAERIAAEAARRREEVRAVVDTALGIAGVEPERVGCVVLGIPAPVDAAGHSPEGANQYWELMNPGLADLFAERGWACRVENDANLAALSELTLDPARAEQSFALLLAGERYGSGLVLGGELLRQRRGGAGELAVLGLVSGVEGTGAVGQTVREAAAAAIAAAQTADPVRGDSGGTGPEEAGPAGSDGRERRRTGLTRWAPEQVRAENVFRLAEEGDAVAVGIVEDALDRLARVCAVLAGPLDLDAVVIGGGIAPAIRPRLEWLHERVQRYLHAPWLRLSTSAAGADAVRIGACWAGIEAVRAAALQD
ncbi:ROK family transcriptional regulator [Rothia kristinae]|uniref:ROK family transcriptional regulator n=1 Tax=Rothia kristinae TaxID=37923 RepID=UPI0024499CA9|nr:ROK family transcriptional regulator [Rothia kristinae]WGH09536.1 ROK family transcriptional regulator [Rothia kristinae]